MCAQRGMHAHNCKQQRAGGGSTSRLALPAREHGDGYDAHSLFGRIRLLSSSKFGSQIWKSSILIPKIRLPFR